MTGQKRYVRLTTKVGRSPDMYLKEICRGYIKPAFWVIDLSDRKEVKYALKHITSERLEAVRQRALDDEYYPLGVVVFKAEELFKMFKHIKFPNPVPHARIQFWELMLGSDHDSYYVNHWYIGELKEDRLKSKSA